MSSSVPLTVAVIGTGSIGRRHLANIRALGARAIACSRSPGRTVTLDDGSVVEASVDRAAAIRAADAVVIATPTDEHMPAALEAAAAGKALFIEKPLSHSAQGVSGLLSACAALVVEVGCQLRAHPGLHVLKHHLSTGADGRILAFRACVGQRLDQWRPGTDYRASYSANSQRGGGALFDLVHEVDLVRWMCGPITGVFARMSRLSEPQLEAEDLVNLIVQAAGGACGNLQMDMLSPVYRRSFEVMCERANYEWNYVDGTLRRHGPEGAHLMYGVPPGFQRNQLFQAHMGHFLNRVKGAQLPPLCSLADGAACMELLLAARHSAHAGRWTTLGGTL